MPGIGVGGVGGYKPKPYVKPFEISNIEKEVLFALISELYGAPGTSNVSIVDLADKIEISKSKVEKVVASLMEKKIVSLNHERGAIIHLKKPFWNLHTVWANEINEKEIKKIDNLK